MVLSAIIFAGFMLQGFLLLLIVSPVLYINYFCSEFGVFAYLGIFIWFFGFVFESVGDRQLKDFLSKGENKGKIMQSGLWKYTRHPNYFGEALMWWGIWILSLGLSGAIYLIFSPLLITCLLRFVSGVPLAERFFAGNKEFEEYKNKTNAMFPWFLKNN